MNPTLFAEYDFGTGEQYPVQPGHNAEKESGDAGVGDAVRQQTKNIPNAYELYQALQDQNVPSKLVVYKGFGHAINKPKELRHVMEQNYEWFSQYVWE